MKLTRRKIGFILLLVISFWVYVWNYSSVRQQLKAILLEEVKKASSGAVDIQAADISLGVDYLSLDSVALAWDFNGEEVKLTVPSVRIYYRVWPLFLFRYSPLELVHHISIEKPSLVFPLIMNVNGNGHSHLEEERLQNFYARLKKIRKLLLLHRRFPGITMHSAEVVVKNGFGEVTVFERLDGTIELSDKNDIICSLNEKNFFLQKKITINMAFLTEQKQLKAELNFKDFPLTQLAPSSGNEKFSVSSGKINGRFSIVVDGQKKWEPEIYSSLYLSKLEGKLLERYFMIENMDILSEGIFLTFNSSPMLWGGNEIVVWAAVATDSSYSFSLKLQADNYDISSINKYLHEKAKLLEGRVDFSGDVNYVYGKGVDFTAYVKSDSLVFLHRTWDKLSGEVNIANGKLKIKLDSLCSGNFVSSLNGEMNFASKNFTVNAVSNYFIPKHSFFLFKNFNGSIIHNNADVEGNLKTLSFKAVTSHFTVRDADTLLAYGGTMELSADTFTVNLQGINGNKRSTVYLLADNVYDNPHFKMLELQNLPIYNLVTLNFMKRISRSVNSSVYMSGDVSHLSGKVLFYDPETLENYMEFKGKAENILTGFKEFSGDFIFSTRAEPVTGRYYFANSFRKWLGFLDIQNIFRCDFKLYNPHDEVLPSLDFDLSVSGLPIFNYFIAHNTNRWEGMIDADVSLRGRLDSLKGNYDLSLTDAILNGVGYYGASIIGNLQDGKLNFKPEVLLNNKSVAAGNMCYDFDNDKIDGDLVGDNIQTSFLGETFFRWHKVLEGEISYKAQLKGKLNRPVIKMQFTVPEITILKEKIENVYGEVTDTLYGYNFLNRRLHKIYIDTLEYVSNNGYFLTGHGMLPINTVDSMRFDAKIQGNMLSHLPRLVPFFTSVDINGNMAVGVYGTYLRPKLDYVNLTIDDGSMTFRETAKNLNYLRAEIEKQKGDPFVHIKNISGSFEGYPAWFYNKRKVVVEGRELQNWKFEALGVDLGVGVFKTTKEGIPLNIKGLQEENVFGFFAMEGFNEDEEFYFAGPVEEPHARGAVHIRNARVTYPFLEYPGSSNEPSRFVEFLEGIELDIKGFADKGVYYFVDIPAYVGSVYMDLDVDRDSHLHFTGKVIDESLRLDGQVIGKRGRVEYLETRFRVEEFGAFFNPYDLYPEVYGQAYTTIRDSLNMPHEIFLRLYALDPLTKQEVQRGRWEDFRFKLVSSDPVVGDNQEMVLYRMGYSVENISSKVTEVGTQLTENYLIRPLVRPFERFMEQKLKLDYVRINSSVAKNLLNYSLGGHLKWWYSEHTLTMNNPQLSPNPALMLLQSSELTMGKYLDRNLFLSYTAQLMSIYESSDLKLNQKVNLEYRFFKNWLLELEYDYFKNMPYYELRSPHDMIIRLRHSFTF